MGCQNPLMGYGSICGFRHCYGQMGDRLWRAFHPRTSNMGPKTPILDLPGTHLGTQFDWLIIHNPIVAGGHLEGPILAKTDSGCH